MKNIRIPSAVLLLAAAAQTVMASELSLESAPPVVVKTIPVAGATNVDPALMEIRVTFSVLMDDSSKARAQWRTDDFPAMAGQADYLPDGRTWVLPVKLEPERFYVLWLNRETAGDFKGANGQPALPYLLSFHTTRGGAGPDTWVSQLNADQRAILEWTDRQFRSFFDARTFAGWTEKERSDLETRLLDALKGPQTREYYQAINTLAALRSTRALPALHAIAFDRADKNCRDRWMAIRALGILGDRSALPDLIHLVYHGNINTRWWAQISLVRITGQNFGKDWKAWGAWWNQQHGSPPFKPEIIRWWSGQAEPDKLAATLDEGDRKFFASLK